MAIGERADMKPQGKELGLPLNCSLSEYNAQGWAGEQEYKVRIGRQEGLATLATLHTHQPTERVCIMGEDSGARGRARASRHSAPKAIYSSLAPSKTRG